MASTAFERLTLCVSSFHSSQWYFSLQFITQVLRSPRRVHLELSSFVSTLAGGSHRDKANWIFWEFNNGEGAYVSVTGYYIFLRPRKVPKRPSLLSMSIGRWLWGTQPLLKHLDFREAYTRGNAVISLECLLRVLPQATAGGSLGEPRRTSVEVFTLRHTPKTCCRSWWWWLMPNARVGC